MSDTLPALHEPVVTALGEQVLHGKHVAPLPKYPALQAQVGELVALP